MKRFVGAFVLILCTAAAARAEDHRVEVSGGYAYLNDQTNSQSLPRGWTAGVAAAVTPRLVIAGEVTGSYLSDGDATSDTLSRYSFLGGPRYVVRLRENVTVFGQFLLGDVHASAGVYSAGSATDDLALQPGGGVDVSVAARWAVRFEGDYRAVRDAGTTFNQQRFVAGIVFRP